MQVLNTLLIIWGPLTHCTVVFIMCVCRSRLAGRIFAASAQLAFYSSTVCAFLDLNHCSWARPIFYIANSIFALSRELCYCLRASFGGDRPPMPERRALPIISYFHYFHKYFMRRQTFRWTYLGVTKCQVTSKLFKSISQPTALADLKSISTVRCGYYSLVARGKLP